MKVNKNLKAWKVVQAYLLYKNWLSFNNLEDDSHDITVDELLDYIEKHIDEEFKSQYNYM